MEFAELMKQLNRKFGPNVIASLEDFESNVRVETVPTGSLRLNRILGGGFPRGRITEIYGPNHSGKTGVLYSAIAEVQRAGGRGCLVDAENALSLELAELVGVDLSKLILVQPDYGEQAFDIIEALIRSGQVDIIGVDSVAALMPRAVIEGSAEDQHVGAQARMLSRCLAKLIPALRTSRTALVFINQLRVNVGAYSPHGPSYTTPGGEALKFYASVRLEIRRGQDIKDGEDVIGHEIRAFTAKNKVYRPKLRCSFNVIYDQGFDTIDEVANLAIEDGIVRRAGPWLTILDPNDPSRPMEIDGEPMKFQGMASFLDALRNNQELFQYLWDELNRRTEMAKAAGGDEQ